MNPCQQIWASLNQLATQGIPSMLGPMSAGTGGLSPAVQNAAATGSVADDTICQECLECELVTTDMIKQVFPRAPASRLQIVADGINININSGKVDNEKRLTHFFGQVRQEIGVTMAFREDLRYRADSLYNSRFSYYRHNRERSNRDAGNEEAIANNAYADANRGANYKLGNTEPGDGWRYRGRGLKQLTGRWNYREFTETHERIWGERIDFEANPDLVDQPLYAVRSGLAFWVDRGLYGIADTGISEETANRITNIINRSTDSYAARWGHVENIWSARIFRDVCFNTSRDLANSQALVPFGTSAN